MIDIQAKIRQGYGEGYEVWASVFNLKQDAKTLLYLQENGIDSYDDLKAKCSAVSGEFSRLSREIRDIETKQKEISELQKQIGTYIKTRAVYQEYNGIKNPRKRNEFTKITEPTSRSAKPRKSILTDRASKEHCRRLRL
jgi:predicted  nucleic acid-binding Zn-ribbon protein